MNGKLIMKPYENISKQELISCIELGKTLTSELKQDELFGGILKKISDMVPADIWSLLLVDQNTGNLWFKMSTDLDKKNFRSIRLKKGEGIAGQVALKQKPVMIENVRKSKYFTPKVDEISGQVTKSIICVPLVYGKKTVGVIEAINPYRSKKKDMEILMIIADYAAIAVENTRQYQEIQNLAIHDFLTGLYNNHYLYEQLEKLTKKSKRTKSPFSLIFMDLDNFKYVVDTYSHLNGSRALQEVASTIKDQLYGKEFAVRYGGDEFIMVLPGHSKERAIEKAENLRLDINNTVYLTKQNLSVQLGASIGVATFPDDANNVTKLLNMADKAMFNIKARGKNAVCGIDEVLDCIND